MEYQKGEIKHLETLRTKILEVCIVSGVAGGCEGCKLCGFPRQLNRRGSNIGILNGEKIGSLPLSILNY